jgi:Ca2+-binding RTX toxin-like protein
VIDRTGVDNSVVISHVGPDQVRVTDTTGVSFTPGHCVAEGPNAALCTVEFSKLIYASIFQMNAGNDTLTITSFPWEAHATGGPGDDTITAPFPHEVPMTPFGPGINTNVQGGPGNDLLIGSEGADWLFGDDGNDRCLAGAGKDRCGLGPGDDICDMGSGRDRCNGRAGRDSCFGGSGKDVCNAGRGRDRCDGGPGEDASRHCERSRRFEESLD